MQIRDRKFTTQAATQLKLKAVLEEDVEWGDFAYHGQGHGCLYFHSSKAEIYDIPEGPDAHVPVLKCLTVPPFLAARVDASLFWNICGTLLAADCVAPWQRHRYKPRRVG